VTLPDAELLKVSIDEAAQKLGDDKLPMFTAAYKAAAERNRKGTSSDKSTISVESSVGISNASKTKIAAESIFGDAKDWSDEDHRKALLFYNLVDERTRAVAGEDKKLNSTEYAELLRDITTEVKKKGKWFGMIPTESKYTIDDVPYDQQLRIRKFLQENGKALNASNIVNAWQMGIGEEPEEE
jgi:hypothetical protein